MNEIFPEKLFRMLFNLGRAKLSRYGHLFGLILHFPNPVNNFLSIELDNISTQAYHIYSITGQILRSGQIDSPENQQLFERDIKHHAKKNFETLPKLLAQKGYSSFQGGKWWEFNYQNGGFTDGMTNGWTAEERKPGHNWFKKFMGGDGLQLARATMEPVYEFIDKNGDQPFFMWYAPELPHYPLNAPEKYYALYRDKAMTESAKRYYANCTWFDDGVGELMRYLKEKGKFENTLFVYVNDNGWEQNPDQEFRAEYNNCQRTKNNYYLS